MWKTSFFQQDSAICHTKCEAMVLLQTQFPGRVIHRFGDQDWPPRSCDLSSMDFFLWERRRMSANKPETVDRLKEKIRRVIGEIHPYLCEKVIHNFNKRITLCQSVSGGHLPDVVFYV